MKKKSNIYNIKGDAGSLHIGKNNRRFKIKGKNNYYSADQFDSHDIIDSHNQVSINGSNYSNGRVVGGENSYIERNDFIDEIGKKDDATINHNKENLSQQGFVEDNKLNIERNNDNSFTVNGENINITDVSQAKNIAGANVNINGHGANTNVDEFQTLKMGSDGSLHITVKNNGVNRTIKVPFGGFGNISADKGQGK